MAIGQGPTDVVHPAPRPVHRLVGQKLIRARTPEIPMRQVAGRHVARARMSEVQDDLARRPHPGPLLAGEGTCSVVDVERLHRRVLLRAPPRLRVSARAARSRAETQRYGGNHALLTPDECSASASEAARGVAEAGRLRGTGVARPFRTLLSSPIYATIPFVVLRSFKNPFPRALTHGRLWVSPGIWFSLTRNQ